MAFRLHNLGAAKPTDRNTNFVRQSLLQLRRSACRDQLGELSEIGLVRAVSPLFDPVESDQ